MRRNIRRGLRLEWFAGLGIALAVPAMAAASSQATQTTLSAETRTVSGHTQATLSVSVAGEDGLPANGAVIIEDEGTQLAGAALGADGRASVVVGVPQGNHSLRAVYAGDSRHEGSASDFAGVHADASGSTPNFGIAVSPVSMTLVAGQSGNVTASVTPINSSSLTAPMFVTLSCSGYPDQSSCTFTPENVEILPNATAAVTSNMVITTQAQPTHGRAQPPAGHTSHPVAWAVLLPGAFSLSGLAFAVRRNRWLSRLSLIGLVALITSLGTTACAPRYDYYNHGPPYNLPTPSGTYSLVVSAQSSNGITATTNTTSFALTVQ